MRAHRTLRAALVAVAALAAALPLWPTPAAAVGVPVEEEADVRLVVRTSTRAAGAEVAEAGVLRGARKAGRVPRLKAVALDVPRSEAESLRRAMLRRPDVTAVDVAHRRWLAEEPADPRFAEQRTYLDAVHATTAWGRPAHGAPGVRIAVVDSGVDVTHPDLAGKIAGTFNAVTRGSDVRDLVGHGTGVASVAAAATGNGLGISGAGYDSTVLAAKVADRTGRIFTDDLAAGIVWAVDSGADVINLSLGGPTSDPLERDAVGYAQQHGVLVVAAAGNEGTRAKQFPAALPGVLSVGATAANGSARAPFSSFGSWVDVGAPGRGVVIATPGGGFEAADGTSFATPLVSGQVALLEAFRPGRTADELAAAVTGGANTAKLGFAGGLVDFNASLDLLPPTSTPSINAPAGGSSVSGVATVSASSSAPRVRLTFADLSAVVTTEAGVAAASFETYGLAGAQTVTATDCSRTDQCSASSVSLTTTVANPAPSLTAPVEGSPATGDAISASAVAPGGAVRFRVEGAGPAVATDTAAPYAADLSTEGLADGLHTVSAVLCREDGSVCDAGNPARATVSVSRLHPRITARSVVRLSPGRDGRNDTTTVSYRLDTRQVATFRVRNAAGNLVLTRRLGEQPAGAASVVWDGRGDAGRFVPSGSYTVEIATRQPSGTLAGLATEPLLVDRVAPRVRQVAVSPSVVNPVRDGYRDSTDVSARLSEDVTRLTLEVRTRSGALVYQAAERHQLAGTVTVAWNGRRKNGSVVPSGSYTARLVAQDRAGNRTVGAAEPVTVSGARLVRQTGSMTVTARKSLTESFADECSLVFRHTDGKREGWLGYYSSGTCTSEDAYAVGDHQVRLPKAASYGWVRVSAYGGRADPKFRDSARITYYDRHQNLSRTTFRLGPALGTHTGPKVKAGPHLIRHRVFRWSTYATGVNWYDVERYTVRFSYYVLR